MLILLAWPINACCTASLQIDGLIKKKLNSSVSLLLRGIGIQCHPPRAIGAVLDWENWWQTTMLPNITQYKSIKMPSYSIGIPIIKTRRSQDCLNFIMGIPTLYWIGPCAGLTTCSLCCLGWFISLFQNRTATASQLGGATWGFMR